MIQESTLTKLLFVPMVSGSGTMLSFVADHARAHGILTLESCENIRNRAAIDLEHDLGVVTIANPDDPGLVILRKDLGPRVTDLALGGAE